MRSGLDAVHNTAQILVLLALLAADTFKHASVVQSTLAVQSILAVSPAHKHVSVAKS